MSSEKPAEDAKPCTRPIADVKALNERSEKLVTEAIVKRAVETELRQNVEKIDFKTTLFTRIRQIYAGSVTSVQVEVTIDGRRRNKSYVAKMNPDRENDPCSFIMTHAFDREIDMLTIISEALNRELGRINEAPLGMPTCYSWDKTPKEETFIMTDLRECTLNGDLKKFKLFNQKQSLNIVHANMAVKVIARLHASSLLLEHSTGIPVNETYTSLLEPWRLPDNEGYEKMDKLMTDTIEIALKVLKSFEKYEGVAEGLLKSHVPLLVKEMFKVGEGGGRFGVLTHNDCWNNNILFRYAPEDEGKLTEDCTPLEAVLIDFQLAGRSSAVNDLLYFIFSTMSYDIRKGHTSEFLDSYYDSFEAILLRAGIDPPFGRRDLEQEFNNRQHVGCLVGMFIIPVAAQQGEYRDPDKLAHLTDDANYKIRLDALTEFSQNSEVMQDRFLPMFNNVGDWGPMIGIDDVKNVD